MVCSYYAMMIYILDMFMTYTSPISSKWNFDLGNCMNLNTMSLLSCLKGFYACLSYFVHFRTNLYFPTFSQCLGFSQEGIPYYV